MRCAMRCTSSHSSPVHLSSQIFLRTRGAKISAPPPGSESSPASRSRRSTSAIGSPKCLWKKKISTAVNALRWIDGLMRFRPGQQLGVVVERQAAVQAVDDVDLGDRIVGLDARAQLRPRLLVRHGVGAGIALLQARERAEHAAGDADVGRVDVQVAVEERAVAVQPLAHLVGQRADLHQIRVPEQRHAVVVRQRFLRAHLVADRREGRRAMASVGVCHRGHQATSS